MKKIILFGLLLILSLSCCDKDENVTEPLPPATQTGAGTFACKVNGESFIDTSGGYFNCFYQLVNGEYYFGISGSDRVDSFIGVTLGTEKKQMSEGGVYQLLSIVDGNAWAGSSFNPNSSSQTFATTDENYSGELTITKFDFTNHIVAGTFWYNIKNPYTNETVEIREGRFDTIFTE